LIRNLLIVVASLLLASTGIRLQAGASSSFQSGKNESQRIKRLVQQLGIESDSASPFFNSDAYEVITDELSEAPREAVKWLVIELQPVADTPIYRYEARSKVKRKQLHMVWCLRALRFLTGKEFQAKTSHFLRFDEELNSSPATFLYGHSPAPEETKVPIPFAREWPSRMRVYIAPKDAQTEIIRQWREWVKAEGATFTPALLDREQVDWVY